MKIAFYKAFQPKATFLDKVIAIFSFGWYSHVELICEDELCYSISARDKKVRFKEITLNSEQWEILNLNLEEPEIKEIREKAKRYTGLKYDYIGAIFSIFPFCIQKRNRMFCSELTANLLRNTVEYHDLKPGCRYSPSGLYNRIKDG